MGRGVEIRSLMGGAITKQPAYANFPNDGLANCLYIGEKVCFYSPSHLYFSYLQIPI